MPVKEKFDFSDIVTATPKSKKEEFDFTDVVDTSVKKKDVTKTGLKEPSSASTSKLPSISAGDTSAKGVSGSLPDYSSEGRNQQQTALEAKKKMFDALANKKLNIERKKAIEPKLTELGDKIKIAQSDIEKANHAVVTAANPEIRDKALQDKAILEQQHDSMAKEFNQAAGEYNSYNKAVVQDEKLNNALLKENQTKKGGASSVSAASIFGKSVYNATIPALVRGIGSTIKVLGEAPEMAGDLATGTELPAIQEKLTDKIGNTLQSWGESLKAEVPEEAKTDIWEKPTVENVASTAGNIIGTLATVIGSGGAGGTALAGTTGMALGVDESYSAAKAAGLSDKDAAKIALPVGVINGLLDVVGLDSILKQFERKAINKALAKETIDYLKDKEITQASAIEATEFAQKEVLKQAAKGAFEVAAKEGVTGGAQAATQIAGEELYDTAKGEDKFKNTLKSSLIDIAKNAALEAAGGGVAGGVFNANPSTNSIYDKAQEINQNEGGMETFLQELDSHVRAAEITPEQADNIKTKVNNLIEVNNTIPAEVVDKDARVQAIDLIEQKNTLEAQVKQLDPAFIGDRKKTISDIEDMLKHIADGTQDEYTYKLDVDSGEYYQIDKAGKETEITKTAFDTAIKHRKTATPEAVSKEGTKTTTNESINEKGGGEKSASQEDAIKTDAEQKQNANEGQVGQEGLLTQESAPVSPDLKTLSAQELDAVKALENGEKVYVQNEIDNSVYELQTPDDIVAANENGFSEFNIVNSENAIDDAIPFSEINNQKNKEDAIQKQTTNETVLRNERPEMGLREVGTGNKESKGTTQEGEATAKEAVTGATLAETARIRKEIGMEEYKKLPESQKEWEAKADEEIAKGYDANKLLNRIDKGEMPTPVEQKIIAKYIATLKAQVGEDPSDKNLAKLKKAIEISDRSAGTAVGKSLAARVSSQPVNTTLADFFIEQMEASGVDNLTEDQKEQNKKEFNDITEAEKALQERVAKLEEEVNKLKAEQEIKGVRKTKKTKSDFKKERQDIISDIREKLKKRRGQLSATPIPYAQELIDIAPDVIRLMRSYVEEGASNLSEIVKSIHDEFKQDIPDLTEKDVVDVIAGKYTEKKQTRNELAAKIKDLRDEAILLNKLEALEKGDIPKSEKKKVERNKQIKDLQEKIKSHDATKISEAKTRIKNEADKLEKDLAEGNYQKEEKKTPLELDKEGLALKDRLIKARQERQVRIWKDEYDNRSKYQKAKDVATEIMNVPRAIMSSMDFSAPLRQGLIQTIAHPKIAAASFKTMFKHAFSQEQFDRWFYDLKESPEYQIIQKSKLYVSDPHDPVLSAKEEQFMTNLASKIPFLGTKLIKGSERAYTSYLNKMRVDLFKRSIDAFESEGKTFENSPELYKSMAQYINASTGRGDLGALENSAQNLATLFFSPRLIASRVNLLTNPINPKFYLDTPKEVRTAYFKDMAKFIGLGVSVLALAKLAGADAEDDPRSSDFGKIKLKDGTRYDIWGGFVQYIRLASQLLTGQTKNATSKQIQELDTKEHNRGTLLMRFGRQKLSPIPATATNLVTGYDFMGDRTDWKNELQRMLPLTPLDIAKAVKDDGVGSLLTVGVPATFGVGVNRYEDKTFVKPDNKTIEGVFIIKDYNPKNFKQKKIFIAGKEQEVTKDQEEKINEIRNSETEKAIKKVLPQLKKLDAETFKDAVNIMYNQYEKEAKTKVFGKDWSDKEKDTKTSTEKTIENNKIRAVLNSIPKFRLQEQEEKKRVSGVNKP